MGNPGKFNPHRSGYETSGVVEWEVSCTDVCRIVGCGLTMDSLSGSEGALCLMQGGGMDIGGLLKDCGKITEKLQKFVEKPWKNCENCGFGNQYTSAGGDNKSKSQIWSFSQYRCFELLLIHAFPTKRSKSLICVNFETPGIRNLLGKKIKMTKKLAKLGIR